MFVVVAELVEELTHSGESNMERLSSWKDLGREKESPASREVSSLLLLKGSYIEGVRENSLGSGIE